MKLLLLSVHFLFVSHSFAQDLSSCADGTPVNTSAMDESKTVIVARTYTLAADLETLTVTEEQNGETRSESFSLTAYGKNTYMAISNSETSTTEEFFIKTDAQLSDLQVLSRDSGGALCGGGLIMTQVKDFTLTTDVQESVGG